MSFSLFCIIEACVLGAACSIDAFVASFAYGSKGIKIPFFSVLIINMVCSLILGVSFFAGNVISVFIPSWLARAMCFAILFVTGACKLFEKSDSEKADANGDKIISPTEAVGLAIALSLDGFGVGIGAALGNVSGLWVCLWSFVTGVLAVMLGCFVGNKVARKIPFNISWLSGVVLIILAFMKLF